MSERSALRRIRDSIVRWSGAPYLYREIRQRRGVTIAYYHDIAPEMLDRHLTVLGRRYGFARLVDCVDALETGNMDVLPPKPLVITLDDGPASNRDLLDVFRAHDVEPTIFLCSGIAGTKRCVWTAATDLPRIEIERLKRVDDAERVATLREAGHEDTTEYPERYALSADEVAEMGPHIDFQSHTVFHPILPRCSDERVERELHDSREELERSFGLDVYALAYPDGAHGDREASAARAAGYRCAVTTVPGVNRVGADMVRLHRIYVPEVADESTILVAASVFPQRIRARLEERSRS